MNSYHKPVYVSMYCLPMTESGRMQELSIKRRSEDGVPWEREGRLLNGFEHSTGRLVKKSRFRIGTEIVMKASDWASEAHRTKRYVQCHQTNEQCQFFLQPFHLEGL